MRAKSYKWLFGKKFGNEEVDKHWIFKKERGIESTPYAESGLLTQKGE